MSDKIQNCLSIESIGRVDHLINIKEISKSETTFNNSNILTNDSLFDENFSTEQSTIYTAIENFIEGEKYITFGTHEKAFLYLSHFLTIVEKLNEIDLKQTEDYHKHPDIYDYYLSEQLISQTIKKLEFLSRHLYNISQKDSQKLGPPVIGFHKCASIPKDMSLALTEDNKQNPKNSSNIFDFNNLIKNKNYSFGSQKLIQIKNQRLNKKESLIRRSISMDMGFSDHNNNSDFKETKTDSNIKISDNKKFCIEKIENYMTGYYKIVVPMVMEQTIRKIEEYKHNVELKPKSKNFVEYSWQNRRKNYIIKALKI